MCVSLAFKKRKTKKYNAKPSHICIILIERSCFSLNLFDWCFYLTQQPGEKVEFVSWPKADRFFDSRPPPSCREVRGQRQLQAGTLGAGKDSVLNSRTFCWEASLQILLMFRWIILLTVQPHCPKVTSETLVLNIQQWIKKSYQGFALILVLLRI